MKKILFLIALIVVFTGIGSVNIAFAQDDSGPEYSTVIDPGSGVNIEDPQLEDITYLALSITRYLVGISGGFIILMLCYGGFQYIAGYMQGDEEGAGTAKSTIFYAIAGLILILTSYMIVSMFQSALTSSSFG